MASSDASCAVSNIQWTQSFSRVVNWSNHGSESTLANNIHPQKSPTVHTEDAFAATEQSIETDQNESQGFSFESPKRIDHRSRFSQQNKYSMLIKLLCGRQSRYIHKKLLFGVFYGQNRSSWYIFVQR